MINKVETLLSKQLIEKGLIKEADMSPLVESAAKSKEGLYQLLLKNNVAPEDVLLKNLAEILKIPFIELQELSPDAAAVEKVPLKIAEYYKMAPLKLVKRKLIVAVAVPMDLRTQDDVRAHIGYEIEIVFAREKDIVEAIKRFYGFAAGTIREIMATNPTVAAPVAAPTEKIDNIEQLAGDATIAKLVNQIIFEAYQKRATDIHLEPYRGKVKLRYRIDGILYNANVQPEISRLILPILSRVKIMSNLNIVEKRMPQDGRAIVKVEDTTLDLRVSSIPTPYGESVVIRMLPMNRVFDLMQLGLNQEQLKIFEKIIQKPHGIIFITGPTGSGKSTTLYACLKRLNSDARKIITIEDPVEYEMDGVTQIQVVSTIGLDFARGLRSMLRHDPDVMMVGEVRDLETAEISIRVALTGHLVFSTLHTNDAASGITRLVDIGVEPYLVASSVEAFVAQRLVRLLCPHCKEEDNTASAEEMKKLILKELGKISAEPVKLYRGKGCNQCNGTGFWGRMAIYELLLMTEKIQRLIMKRAAASEIKEQAARDGMVTLRCDGWLKVLKGLTTPDEILKVAERDENAEKAAEEVGREVFLQEDKILAPSETRRMFERLDRSINIRYKVLKKANGPAAGTPPEQFAATVNISAGGLLFTAKENLTVGSILEMKIEIMDDAGPVECLTRVVRVQEIEEGQLFEIAVCYLDLSSGNRARLDKYVVEKTRML